MCVDDEKSTEWDILQLKRQSAHILTYILISKNVLELELND